MVSAWPDSASGADLSEPPPASLATKVVPAFPPSDSDTGTTIAAIARHAAPPTASTRGSRRTRARRITLETSISPGASPTSRIRFRSSDSLGTIAASRCGPGAGGTQAVGRGAVIGERDRHLGQAVAQIALDRA